jgi:parallel beta-helix repeat protein
MNSRTQYSIAALVLLAGAALVTAGPLNPPAGPVASSMKTMTEVEPRIAINLANTPGNATALYRITAPGSYYLTGNLQGILGQDVIRIDAANVTLDLNGFTISGGANGVYSTTYPQVTVCNGNFTSCGLNGVNITFANYASVRNVNVSNVGGDGIYAGYAGTVDNCHVNTSGGVGIRVADYSVVSNSLARACGSNGFVVGQHAKAADCIATGNSGEGFVSSPTGGFFTGCFADSNIMNGFHTTGYATLEHCHSENNTLVGFMIGDHTELKSCSAEQNTQQGARAGSYCRIIGNSFNGNSRLGGAYSGLWIEGSGCRIEENDSTQNGWGLYVTGTSNIIVKNNCRGNSAGNYSITGSNEAAPIVTSPGSNGFATMTAWSNVSY